MRVTKLAVVPVFLVVALASACSDSTGPGEKTGTRSGTISFNYGGDFGSGSFRASGAPRLDGSGNLQEWTTFAGGEWDRAAEELTLVAFRQINGTRGDVIDFYLEGITGPRQNIPLCVDADCGGAVLIFGSDMMDEEDIGDGMCFVVEGTLNLSTLTDREARGTFSGVGACMLEDGSEEEIQITGGSFDVGLF